MTTLISKINIKSWGNSLAIRVPKKVIHALNLHDGSQISVFLDKDKIVLKPEKNEFLTLSTEISLKSLISKITTENLHTITDFDDEPKGNEIW